MKENMISIGLDIGTTKIVAMIGQTNEYNKMKILGVGKSISLGVHRGVVNNITQTIQSIQKAVSEAEGLSGIKVDGVTVGRQIDEQDVLIVDVPEKHAKRLAKMSLTASEKEILEELLQIHRRDDHFWGR